MKDMRAAIRACTDAGLRYDPAHKHPRVVHPTTGRYVTFSQTPGCPHAANQFLRDVRKYLGVTVAR